MRAYENAKKEESKIAVKEKYVKKIILQVRHKTFMALDKYRRNAQEVAVDRTIKGYKSKYERWKYLALRNYLGERTMTAKKRKSALRKLRKIKRENME